MKVNRKIVVIALLPALAGCGIQNSECAPAEVTCNNCVAKAPSLGFFADNRITEIRYVRVATHISDPKPKTILKISDLSAEDADLLAKADCGSWESKYEDDRVCDGMRWIVEFVSGDRVVKSVHGFNAEPDGLKYLLDAAGILGHRHRDSEIE